MRVLAYLDPGSGSMILQTILGGFAAVFVAMKMFGKRVYRVVVFWRDHDDEQESKPAATATVTVERERETEKEPV